MLFSEAVAAAKRWAKTNSFNVVVYFDKECGDFEGFKFINSDDWYTFGGPNQVRFCRIGEIYHTEQEEVAE
jgi:hypothetical protein